MSLNNDIGAQEKLMRNSKDIRVTQAGYEDGGGGGVTIILYQIRARTVTNASCCYSPDLSGLQAVTSTNGRRLRDSLGNDTNN